MKKAILITGQMRFIDNDHLTCFINMIEKYDVFICTYKKSEQVARKISNNILFFDDFSYKIPKKKNIFQWIHLDILLKNYKNILLNYDILYKIRTDITFDEKIFDSEVKENTIYLRSDLLFYGKTNHFYDTFNDFYESIYKLYWGKSNTYVPLNYNNILKISDNDFKFIKRWGFLIFPKKIYNRRFFLFKKNIEKCIINDIPIIEEDTEFTKHNPTLPIFTTEKSILIHCINKGIISGIPFKINLPGKIRFKSEKTNLSILEI